MTNWITIVGRDKRTCVYCGDKQLPVSVAIINTDKQSNAGNSATVCKECRKSKAKKLLGMPGTRILEREVRRRNMLIGISDCEPVDLPTDAEQVDAGNFVRRLPPRGNYPYRVSVIPQ